MENILIPLALLGLAGGLFNLPAYLGSGLLDSFLAPLSRKEKSSPMQPNWSCREQPSLWPWPE